MPTERGVAHNFHQPLKDSVGDARVATFAALNGLVDLIQKHNTGPPGDDCFESTLQAALRVTYPFGINLGQIKAYKRDARLFRQGFRELRLAGSCWPHQEATLRHHAQLATFHRSHDRFAEIALDLFQAAELFKTVLDIYHVQHVSKF